MGRDLIIRDKLKGTYDVDGCSLDVIESFFIKSWPKWYEKHCDPFFNYIIKTDRKTLVNLYNYINNKEYTIDLPNYRRDYILDVLRYILTFTGRKDKTIFEFW